MHKNLIILFLLFTMALPSVYSIVQKQIKAIYCLVEEDDDNLNDLDDKTEKKIELDKYFKAQPVFCCYNTTTKLVAIQASIVASIIQQCYLEVHCPPPNVA